MTYRHFRRYTGPLRAVIFDWAGTAVDHGCLAPVGVFREVFARHGVEVSIAEAREPMGTHKREHIRRMCEMPRIAAAWRAVHDRLPSPEDIDGMYVEMGPLALETLPDYADPIAGVVDTVRDLRVRDLKIGSTTGYNREMLDLLEAEAARRGYAPDCAVAASECSEGRPGPYLCWTAAMRLGVWPAEAVVKVGDTVVDVHAGLNAGMWSVGVALTGNEVGLDAAGWRALPDEERSSKAETARKTLREAGAHWVIDRVADLGPVLDEIEDRLRRGERP